MGNIDPEIKIFVGDANIVNKYKKHWRSAIFQKYLGKW